MQKHIFLHHTSQEQGEKMQLQEFDLKLCQLVFI